MKKQSLFRYTERAIRATEAGKLIPPIVYLPRLLRGQAVTLTEDNLCLTMDAPTVEENHIKITNADPVGFLIAVMHGQPIPEFRISQRGAVQLFYNCPVMSERIEAARYLAHKATIKRRPQGQGGLEDRDADRDYRAMVSRAEGALRESNDANGRAPLPDEMEP